MATSLLLYVSGWFTPPVANRNTKILGKIKRLGVRIVAIYFGGRDLCSFFLKTSAKHDRHLGKAGFSRVFSNFNASFDFVLRRDSDYCKRQKKKKTVSAENSFYSYLLVVRLS